MKTILFILLTLNLAHAVTGLTEGCSEKAVVMANEGEKFVTVKIGNTSVRLESLSGQPFSMEGKETVTFVSPDRKTSFEMTSVVMNSLPRLKIHNKKCAVNLHGPTN